MTTTHMLSRDIAALCAAIDDGDDSALGPLADALEEAGQEGLAAGLRRSGRPTRYLGITGMTTGAVCSGYYYGRTQTGRSNGHGVLDWATFARLDVPGSGRRDRWRARWVGGCDAVCIYPTRSAAYLAMAEALKENK